MLDCETWYDLAGRRHNEQRFAIPLEDLPSLRHAVAAIRRRNPAFHIRLHRRLETAAGVAGQLKGAA